MRAILTYHSIDSSGSAISMSEEAFRAHVRFLASGRVRVVALGELPTVAEGQDAIALTFDDGFRNFASAAAPVLSAAGLPATVFVVSDAVGGTNEWDARPAPGIPTLPLMSWDEVHAAAEAGFGIGAHTRRHPDLTTVDHGRLEDELAGCVERCSSELGQRPRWFAYPYGAVNDVVARAARDVFEWSCTTAFRPVEPGDDRALLPRLDAYYFRGAGQLESWGTPAFRRRLWVRAQGRRVKALLAGRTGAA